MIGIRGRERMFIGKFGNSEGEFSHDDGEPKVKTGACYDDEVGCDSAVAEVETYRRNHMERQRK